jgi:hypothetical protein
MNSITIAEGVVVHHFAYLDIEKWLHSVRFHKAVPPPFIGKKRTLTKEQQEEFSKARDNAANLNNILVNQLMGRAHEFFGEGLWTKANGWGKRALLVPIRELGAWLDHAFKDTPEMRPQLDLDKLADDIAEGQRAKVQAEIVTLDSKRTALEAELAEIAPLKQVKRARHE